MNFDVRGIDLDGISKMVQVISMYKRECINALSTVTRMPKSVLNSAIRGNAQVEYNASVNRLNNRMTTVINQLAQFESALNNEIRMRYQSGEQRIASSTFSGVK